MANDEANRLKDDYISTEHLFLAIASERNTPVARLLRESGVTKERIQEAIKDVRGGQRVTDRRAETRYRMLEKFSRDLTQMAREGKLDPVIGRDDEILRVIQILCRRTKNNPVLIGEAGRGQDRHRRGIGAARSPVMTCPRFCWGSGSFSSTWRRWSPGPASGASSRSG